MIVEQPVNGTGSIDMYTFGKQNNNISIVELLYNSWLCHNHVSQRNTFSLCCDSLEQRFWTSFYLHVCKMCLY